MTKEKKLENLEQILIEVIEWSNRIGDTPPLEHPEIYIKQSKKLNSLFSLQSKKKLNLLDIHNFISDYDYLPSISFFNQLITLIQDEIFFIASPSKTKGDFLKFKLLQARRTNFEFEEKLAKILCGDNTKFPYKSGYYITKFFEEAGFNYKHDGSTRYIWITNVLKELNIEEIYILIENLFKKKYFVDFCKTKNLDLEEFIKKAREEFSLFITESLEANDIIDFSSAFDLNINTELLFDKITSTQDIKLNEFLDKAKDFYIEGKSQEAIEKLWDAFERIKTYLPGKGKKEKTQALVSLLSTELEYDIFDEEFVKLSYIGNNYMIRHTETDKIPINEEYNKDYLFFRMLALLNLAIEKINLSEQKTN